MSLMTESRRPKAVISKQRIQPLSYGLIPFAVDERSEERFVQVIKERLGAELNVTPLGRARTGVYLLSRYASEKTGRRKVLMSPYTVPDVVNMVVLAGAEPVFFDHERNSTRADLDYLRQAIDDDTACVILTHYHVNERRIDQIARLCRSHGAYLFDDCALVFGGNVDGRPIGGLTDASVFSFSSFKLLNFFWGGMVTTSDSELAAWLHRTVSAWPRLQLKDYARQARVCVTYDFATRPPIFSSIVFPRLLKQANAARAAKTLEHVRLESVELDSTLTSRPHPSAFGEWLRKMPKTDDWLARRREIARIYHTVLAAHAISAPLSEADFTESCFVNYPVAAPPERRDDICLAMMQKGYDVGRSLYPNCHKQPRFTHLGGKSDSVDRLAASALYLPTHYGVSDDYARAVAAALAEHLT